MGGRGVRQGWAAGVAREAARAASCLVGTVTTDGDLGQYGCTAGVRLGV